MAFMIRSLTFIVGIMAVAGWASLSMPFRGDEALFAVVAHGMADGAVLYRDHWDITNPGIFGFYLVGGTAFGFTEEGIRLFEWCWMTAFVLAVSEASRRATGAARLPLAPALFVGVIYYLAGYSATSTLTKTEGLVCFPLFLAVWFASRSTDERVRPWPRLIAAGMAGGIAILFKLLLASGLGVAWLFLLVAFLRSRKRGWRSMFEYCGGLGVGLLLVVGPVASYFAAHDALGELVRTLFELPPRFLAEGDRAGIERLALSGKWFLGQYAFVLAAAVLGLLCRKRTDPFLPALAILLVCSFGIIVAQQLSWWSYHFVLPGGLAGAIAAYGWPGIVQAVRDRFLIPEGSQTLAGGRRPPDGDGCVIDPGGVEENEPSATPPGSANPYHLSGGLRPPANVCDPSGIKTRLNRALSRREIAALLAVAFVLLLEPLGGSVFQCAKLAEYDFGLTASSRKSFRLATGSAYAESFAETEWLAQPGAEPGPICVIGDPLFYWHSGRRPAVRISGWSLEMYPREIRIELAEEVGRTRPVYLFVSTGYQPLLRERYPELQAILDMQYIRIRHSNVGDWYRLR